MNNLFVVTYQQEKSLEAWVDEGGEKRMAEVVSLIEESGGKVVATTEILSSHAFTSSERKLLLVLSSLDDVLNDNPGDPPGVWRLIGKIVTHGVRNHLIQSAAASIEVEID